MKTGTTPKPRKLSAKQLLAKFPKMPRLENCLENMACPKCGNRDQFQIEMTGIVPICDDGTEDHADTDWDKNSYCQCSDCQHEGKVRDFTFPGLEDRIAVNRLFEPMNGRTA